MAIAAGVVSVAALGSGLFTARHALREWLLVRELQSGQPTEATIQALVEMRSLRALPMLLEVAAAGEDGGEGRNANWRPLAAVAKPALEELVRKLEHKALPPLFLGLESSNAAIRKQTIDLLLLTGCRTDEMAHRLVKALQDPDESVGETAAAWLTAFGVEAVLPLTGAIANQDFELNGAVLSALGYLSTGARSMTPALLARLHGEPPESRAGAASALKIVGGSSMTVVRGLVEALADENAELVDASWVALYSGVGGKHAVPTLQRALMSANAKVQGIAANVLGHLGNAARPAIRDLLAQLRHGDPIVREYTARALGQIGDDGAEARAALIRLLRDPGDRVRLGALGALYSLGGVSAIPEAELQAMLADASPDVRDSAAGLYNEKCGPDRSLLPWCLEALSQPSVPNLAFKILRKPLPCRQGGGRLPDGACPEGNLVRRSHALPRSDGTGGCRGDAGPAGSSG